MEAADETGAVLFTPLVWCSLKWMFHTKETTDIQQPDDSVMTCHDRILITVPPVHTYEVANHIIECHACMGGGGWEAGGEGWCENVDSDVVVSAPLLENAILAFGNGSDVKTGASQPGMPSPATDNQSPFLATTPPGVSMETEQSILRAQIPTQVRQERRREKLTNGEVLLGFVCFETGGD